MPRQTEFQIKFAHSISPDFLSSIGAKRLSHVVHTDSYYLSPSRHSRLIRVRKENDNETIASYRSELSHEHVRGVIVDNIGPKELNSILKNYRHVLDMNKQRTIYSYKSVIINVDHVDTLGDFVELVVTDESAYEDLMNVAKRLKLPLNMMTTQTYFQLAYTKANTMSSLLSTLSSNIGRFSFGISSGVLTTLGIVIVLNTSTYNFLAVIAGIIGVAVADSMSDALGVYSLKKSERGVKTATALRSAIATLIGKIACTSSFIIPFILFEPSIAIYVCILWGVILLTFVNVQIARIQQESVAKTVFTNLLVATIVIALSFAVGNYLSLWG
ncbi:MAG TPA: CYTH domain-containing protein [Acidobacteriota bacterium]|nr:CYTH domain-containing protein [Acidobacteriota bacterium]